jgi:hypothetical protein
MNKNYAPHLRGKPRLKSSRCQSWFVDGSPFQAGSFQCRHCRRMVTTDPLFSGVQNRNHCPYCLWSRHLDLRKAGDRLAACKGLMEPIALTLKKVCKKYQSEPSGELMLVHHCQDFQHLSINRIAGDDNLQEITAVYRSSFKLEVQITARFAAENIFLLKADDEPLVYRQLFGRDT